MVVQNNKGGTICTTYYGGTIKHSGTDNETKMNKDKHIPAGYKSSPLGPIPEDWEVKRIEDFAPLQRGFDLPTDRIVKGKYPVVYSNGILNFHNEYKAKGPGVVTGRSGTIGKVTYVEQDYWPHNTSLWVTDFKNNNPRFVFHLYKYLDLSKFASGSGVPTLNRNDVHAAKIAIPPIVEQHRIVSVLSLWDTAIEKQTALIEKLTLRKRGLMQQLLTGKKRLKGFEGGAFHRLGNYISECNRRNKGCNRVLSVTNTRGFILQEEQFDKIVASNDTSNYKVVCQGEFAYNPSRVNVGSLAMLTEYDEGILSPMYIVFKANENIDKNYLLQCLQSYWFRGHIPAYTQGSVRDSLSFDGLCSMKFYIPTLQEQKAISAILEHADKEIEIQKQKLTAMQEEKKGLMQVLLTGKKRIQ